MKKVRSIFIKSIILPIADSAMKTSISSSIRQIKRMRQFSKNEIENWQNKKLQSLIKFAYENTEYYKNLFDKINLNYRDIKTYSDLCKIPVLTKKNIRDNFKDIIPSNIDSIPHKKTSTGGSTGDPLIYYQDYNSWSFCNANSIINWERTGYRYGDKFIALGSTSLFVSKKTSLKHRIYYKLKNKIGLNGVNMSDDVCKEYIDFIKKNKIRFIYGYASSIYLLSKYVIKANQKVEIKACFTTSEVLQDHFKDSISEAFDCDIMNCYGANDGGITAFSLNDSPFNIGYNCLVRIESYGNENNGPALLTDLFNYAMPLINYKIGDEVELLDKVHNTKHNGQLIKKVYGRTSDVIELENGNNLTGPGFTVLFSKIPVDYYCIEKTGMNSLICWIIKLPDFNDKHEKIIIETLHKHAGQDAIIELRYTETPFLTASGKRMYFIS
jgi:phenylacetate-CoA ligase